MVLPPLATVAELAAWMQREPAELPPGAPLVLDTASAIVRSEARQRFTRGTTMVALVARERVITLPQRPVLGVELVRVAGRVLRTDEYRVIPGGVLVLVPLGHLSSVAVTYRHGYAETPGDVRAIVLTLAARVLNNPGDLRQESVGSVSVTYAAESIGASLAAIERDQLARYRPRAAVVQLGTAEGRRW
ncbi:hypothetical protein [Streptomyces qinzhouensis]|uniref:Uncharacterized protein n=1 Tax=Streptomyces qinzhouensis TaxID=2599401 RepID=A0A5B8JPK4_9ACTN|nr:hypothetical protein [Streptomyces qinzhouensis]QDY79790.1 hypothetical protein FQU76_28305 [Streptomyces qinzhouensis]